MIEMLEKAIELNKQADTLAMTCAGTHDFGRLDQLVCDADNTCRDFVRRHGDELMHTLRKQRDELYKLRQKLAAARFGLVEYGAHQGSCSIGDYDDEGRHCACDCGYEAALKAAGDEQCSIDSGLHAAWERDPDQ